MSHESPSLVMGVPSLLATDPDSRECRRLFTDLVNRLATASGCRQIDISLDGSRRVTAITLTFDWEGQSRQIRAAITRDGNGRVIRIGPWQSV